MVAGPDGGLDFVHPTLLHELADGEEKTLGGFGVRRVFIGKSAVARNLGVFCKADFLLEFHHGKKHKGYGDAVGNVVFAAYAVGKGVDVAG